MLKPNFLLTKKVSIDIIRQTQGSYVNGDWVEGTETTVPTEVNIQPLKDSEILLLPESERTKEWYKLYSAEELRTAKEGTGGYGADSFTWNGDNYRVMKARRYQMGTLDHWKCLAARIPLTPN
jgi:hypothetical protein